MKARKEMKAGKACKKMKARKARKKMKALKSRKKMKARTKQRHEGTQALKALMARRHWRHLI